MLLLGITKICPPSENRGENEESNKGDTAFQQTEMIVQQNKKSSPVLLLTIIIIFSRNKFSLLLFFYKNGVVDLFNYLCSKNWLNILP